MPKDKFVYDYCSRVFLIDAQNIQASVIFKKLYGVDEFVEPEIFSDDGEFNKGQDSIQFQQLRSYELANALIELNGKEWDGKIAIIGGGVSGITAAIILLSKMENCKVEIFDYHGEVLSRFSGGYGRRVHPFHHVRKPADSIKLVSSEYGWSCPITGANVEIGGIPEFFSWRAGPIEKIRNELQNRWTTFKETNKAKNLSTNLRTRVENVIEKKSKKIGINIRKFDEQIGSDTSIPEFDIVILAPGGLRNEYELVGQSNHEYWNPVRLANMKPQPKPANFSIIGSGNTAASEVYNSIFKKLCFAEIISSLQVNIPHITKIMGPDYSVKGKNDDNFNGTKIKNAKDFADLLSADEWEGVVQVFQEKCLGQLIARPEYISVTMHVRNVDLLFRTMNSVNRFLCFFLNKMEVLKIHNKNSEASKVSKQKDGLIVLTHGSDAHEVDRILYCAHKDDNFREYQKLFVPKTRVSDVIGEFRVVIANGNVAPLKLLFSELISEKHKVMFPNSSLKVVDLPAAEV